MLNKTFKEKTYTLDILYHIGNYQNSIHFIFDHASKTCAIIDPAWEPDVFIKKINDSNYKLTDIWLTHWHPDHTNATDEVVAVTGAKVIAGVFEKPYIKINSPIETVNDNDIISLGKTKIQVINTPGHSAGGVCYLLDGHLIAGDTLFIYGSGHCSLIGSNANKLFHSMKKLKKIADEVLLHCGHDYGTEYTTTMGKQKSGNPFLIIDNEKDFVNYRNNIHDNTRSYPMSAMTKADVEALL